MEQPIKYYRPKIQPYSIKDLCRIYNVGYKTMHKWIETHLGGFGKKTTHLFTFAQVEALFNAIGTPVIEQFGIGTNFRLHELIPVAYDPLDKRFIR